MTTPRTTSAAVAAALLSLLLAGCGGGDDSATGAAAASPPTTTAPSGPSAPSTSSDPSASATPVVPLPATASPPVTGPARCTTGQLRLGLGPEQGAAGSTYRPLTFVNTGGAACTLDGHPGVSYVAGDAGAQVGAAAGRTGTPALVTLAPGATASALLRVVNPQDYDPATCTPTPVAGLRVYPPDDTAAAFLPGPATGCAATGLVLLTVGPVRAGAEG